MKKSLTAIFIILPLITFLSIWETSSLEKISKEFISQNETVIASLESGDNVKTLADFEVLEKMWQEKADFLMTLRRHDDADSIADAIAQAGPLIRENERGEALACLRELLVKFLRIYEQSKVSLVNVF